MITATEIKQFYLSRKIRHLSRNKPHKQWITWVWTTGRTWANPAEIKLGFKKIMLLTAIEANQQLFKMPEKLRNTVHINRHE